MSDAIALTISRNDYAASLHQPVPSTVRIERTNHVDKDSVLYRAEGPFSGITINKRVQSLQKKHNVPDVVLDFTCFILKNSDFNKQIKERRQLCFWFENGTLYSEKNEKANRFLVELLDPETFPQDVVLFIKKAVLLMRGYSTVRCLDISFDRTGDVRTQDAATDETYRICLASTLTECPEQTIDESDEEEEREAIRNYVTVLTPDKYDYQFVPEVPVTDKRFITFRVKAAANAHICLSAIYGNLQQKTVEVTIGGKNNSRSWITENAEGAKRCESVTKNVLSDSEFRNFWISWKDGLVEVGEGNLRGRGRFMYWSIPEKKQFHVNCMAVSSDKTGAAEWEFVDIIYPGKSKAERRAKARASLLWLAKKQRMLNVLEDAYPDSVSTSDLLRIAKIKLSDMMSAVVLLKDMQNKNLIKEVSKGAWMRMPGGSFILVIQNVLSFYCVEVKMVTNMPILTGREQPRIAVITAMYCEKLAVDTMLSDKVTYVRYIKQGDSSVYTLGKIGKHQVISTKLSRVGGNAAANISAENAITRLLGTFNRVDHVILVGVAGGVPNFTDYFRHVRLGDVVVSVPDRGSSDSLYTYCEKMEFNDLGQVSFSTKTWASKTDTLQNVVRRLRDQENQRQVAPWEKYIDEGKESLHGDESAFYRPSSKTDKIVRANENGELLQYEHPAPPAGVTRNNNRPVVHLGAIGSGKFISRNDVLRDQFADICGVIAFDYEFDSVLKSLEGNRNDSFILIRGAADYADGSKMKEWQPYAALAAAAYMKAVVMALPF
ncbi:uncharacterized protein LOC141910980 isoform X2 [Tubulanus polymorphus]|uniref:uncharacterized protein LOC141910980 isoform X2 n=1 Tax=Tubulanus polymorphus TaxID=672921 RepID=UPI003DA513A6